MEEVHDLSGLLPGDLAPADPNWNGGVDPRPTRVVAARNGAAAHPERLGGPGLAGGADRQVQRQVHASRPVVLHRILAGSHRVEVDAPDCGHGQDQD
jgi:hypothetical protein